MGKLNEAKYQGSANPHWKGGYKEYYGPNWNIQRRAARKRDKHRCQCCGKKQKTKAFDVHHVRPFRTFGYVVGVNDHYLPANDLTNLITLCPSCHTRAENGKIAFQPYLL